MLIIEINALSNGAHRNQTGDVLQVPDGWAVVPDDMTLENFPFGNATTEEVDGVMAVTGWTAGTIPEPEPEPSPQPTEVELLEDVICTLDAEYDARITATEDAICELDMMMNGGTNA